MKRKQHEEASQDDICRQKTLETEQKERQKITLSSPDDFHLHLRDGAGMESVVLQAARQFSRAIIMPNLRPPVVNAKQALEYRGRILAALTKQADIANIDCPEFTPLMTLYLTDKTTPEDIKEAKASGHVYACKLYPAGATTNSDSGVTDIKKIYPALKEMSSQGILLLVHSEVTDQDIDIFDREAVFIERHLRSLVTEFPQLKVVMEHVTTKAAVDFVLSCGSNVAATITAHHMLYNRNRLFKGGICPHYYCLPILKTEPDRLALLEMATTGNPKFFAGTDSAPHTQGKKETSCGCAGCYTSHAALELYAEAFAGVGRLDKLEAFLSKNGSVFYGLPCNKGSVTLVKDSWVVPESYPFGNEVVIPLRANESIDWKMK